MQGGKNEQKFCPLKPQKIMPHLVLIDLFLYVFSGQVALFVFKGARGQRISYTLFHVLDKLTQKRSALCGKLLIITKKIDFRFGEFHGRRIEQKELGSTHFESLADPLYRVEVRVVLFLVSVEDAIVIFLQKVASTGKIPFDYNEADVSKAEEKVSVFEDIKTGVNQAIELEKANHGEKTT